MEPTTAVAVPVEPRRYDPPQILWYFGALTAALAARRADRDRLPRPARDLAVPGRRRADRRVRGAARPRSSAAGWRVPGGVLVAAAVVLVPTVGAGIRAADRRLARDSSRTRSASSRTSRARSSRSGSPRSSPGSRAYALVRFPFVFVTVTVAVLLTAQLLVPVFVDGGGIDDHMSTFIVTGARALPRRPRPRLGGPAVGRVLVARDGSVRRSRSVSPGTGSSATRAGPG